jgi:hypothetical protein
LLGDKITAPFFTRAPCSAKKKNDNPQDPGNFTMYEDVTEIYDDKELEEYNG